MEAEIVTYLLPGVLGDWDIGDTICEVTYGKQIWPPVDESILRHIKPIGVVTEVETNTELSID